MTDNIFENESFEGDATEIPGHENIRYPAEWWLWYADETTFNKWDENNTPFTQPEAHVLSKSDIPPGEWDDFFVHGNKTWKCFARGKPIYITLQQLVDLQPGKYRFAVNIFPDLVSGYTDDLQKIPAQDPQSGMLGFFIDDRRIKWTTLMAGDPPHYLSMNRYECEFDVDEPGPYFVGIDVILPQPLENNGFFADAFELYDISEPELPAHTRTVHLAPTTTGPKQMAQILAVSFKERHAIAFNENDALGTSPNIKNIVHVWDAWKFGGGDALRAFAEQYYPPQPEWIWHQFKKLEVPIWDKDITGELATNPGPYEHPILQAQGGWWQRRLDQIDAVTIHHTLSDSPHATAEHYVQKDGGRPTLPYTIWVTQMGEILKCVDLEQGLWHDHTGNENTHLSIGLAGRLHEHRPSEVQLDAAVKVAAWAINSPTLPGVKSIDDIKGHSEYTATVCPGWLSDDSGDWIYDFYYKLSDMLGIPDIPPADIPKPLLTFHLQESVPDWPGWVEAVQPEVFKLVGEFERAPEINAVSPKTLVWIRQVDDDTGKYIGTQPNGYLDKPPPDVAARMFLDTFWPQGEIPSWFESVDIISGLNETIATGNTAGTRSAVAFEVAFSDLVASLGTHIKASLLATAVGNPGHNEVELLLPAAEAAVRNGHYIDDHLYFPCNPVHSSQWMIEEALHHHMRSLLSWDPVFNAHGLYPLYLAGECGAIGAYVREDGRPGGYIGAGAGFRHPGCLNGNWPWYLNLLLAHQEMIVEWNKSHGNRFRGMALFTVGGPGRDWDLFELNADQREQLADALQ